MLPSRQPPSMHSAWDARAERMRYRCARKGPGAYVGPATPLDSAEGYDLVTVHCPLAQAAVVLCSKDPAGS